MINGENFQPLTEEADNLKALIRVIIIWRTELKNSVFLFSDG